MMAKIVSIVVIYGGAFASFVGTHLSLNADLRLNSWHFYWLVAASAFTLLAFVSDISQYMRTKPKIFKVPDAKGEIVDYMCHWLSSGGRTVIFSRDMSWASHEAVRRLLSEKAKKHELVICLQNHNESTAKLANLGAEIYAYGHLGEVPLSRFTIVDYEKHGARVAVGLGEDGKHVIKEYQKGKDPFFSVAEDLVRYVIASCKSSQHAP
jgi:hypothetical protein